MKKSFFYVALASVALTSCSKHDDHVVNNGNNNDDKQAIQFVMGSPIEITTRGTGAVGDIEGGANYWAGEELNVFMFDRGLETLKITKNETTGTDYFNDATIWAPTAEEGLNAGKANYGAIQYYPGSGEFEFFAYRADDAAVKEHDKNVITKIPSENAPTSYTVEVNIDGTQDLMFAKATMNQEDSTKLTPESMHRVYSSYAARRDIHPRFNFEHLLSRLVFNVEAAEEEAGRPNSEDTDNLIPEEDYRGVWIDSIKILDVHNNGTMTVAYIGEKPQNIITWNTDIAKDTLSLKNRTNAGETTFDLEPFQPMFGKSLRVGESMLLPASESYELMVYYSQYPSKETYDDNLKAKFTYFKKLEPAGGFQSGMQYNVNIKVYGAQQIQLELELTPWAEGEDIPVDSEDEENH